MKLNLDSLRGYIDSYFESYSKNRVSNEKILFEIIAWLTVNFILEIISCDDFYVAISYAEEHIAKREVKF